VIKRVSESQPCIFCGGDRGAPGHVHVCDGRQGAVEAAIPDRDLPRLISGIDPSTYATSAAAAEHVEPTKAQQRELVYRVIDAAGDRGCTDDEIQLALRIDGSSERPRRWELWKQQRIQIACDDRGDTITRPTRTLRKAVVWIAARSA